MLNGMIFIWCCLFPIFSNVVNLHFFRYSQSEFGVAITSFPAIMDTSKFENMYCAISFVTFYILYAHVEWKCILLPFQNLGLVYEILGLTLD